MENETVNSSESTTPPVPSAKEITAAWEQSKPKDKSWGDLHRDSLHWWASEIGVNYLANVTISVGLTYLFEKTLGGKYNEWLSNKLKDIENPTLKEVSKFVVKFATKSQILLMGGHTLLPFMKDFHDNKHRQSFWMGNKLDGLQEMLGMGNEATKENRADYAKLTQLMKDKPKQVNEEEARILSKYGINNSFDFIEEKKNWKDIILSRLRAMSYSLMTNAAIGGIEANTLDKATGTVGLYNRGWANPISEGGGWMGKVPLLNKFPGLGKIFSKIPGFKKVFPDSNLFAREYANDLILTAASTIGFSQGIKASDAKGPKHEDLLDDNRTFWATHIGRNFTTDEAAKTIDAGGFKPDEVKDMQAMLEAGRKSPAQNILNKDRPAAMSEKVQADRSAAEQEAALASRQ